MVKLAILICSLESRKDQFLELLNDLTNQVEDIDDVRIIFEVDNGEMPIGKKRNLLLERAESEYVCFVDDDDQVSNKYVKKILAAIESKPDCVGIKLNYFENGLYRGVAHHSIKYDSWRTIPLEGRIVFFERSPNHLNPIKTELAKLVRFPEIDHGEDLVWSTEIQQYLKEEIEIDKPIYNYKYMEKR